MKVMRIRHAKLIVAVVVIANLILFYYSWKSTIWKSLTSTLMPGDAAERAASADNELGGMGAGAAGRGGGKSPRDKLKNANKHIRKSITVVFRSFYNFENDLKASIDNLLDIVPNLSVLVLLEGTPYPPVTYERNITATSGEENTVRFINLGFDVQKTPEQLNALAAIHTKYVLFLPDSVRLTSKNLLQKILREINSAMPLGAGIAARAPLKAGEFKHQQEARALLPPVGPEETVRRLVIVPFAGNMKSFSSCTQINLDLPNWTIQYVAVNSSDKCDLYLQKHAILVDVGVLKVLPDPFVSPFPEMFYIQAKLAGISKTVFPQTFQDGRRLFASYHTKQRRTEIRRRQFKELYKKLQIKRIIRRSHKVITKSDTKESGGGGGSHHNLVLDTQFSSSNFSLPLVTEIDLIGCERTTKSCVGTVYNNRPFYIYLDKHTPPCCLDKLKTTFNHVLEEFENVGIRYWLDNQALRTAIETNHLHPDAYEIDISFNVNDLERSNAMKKSQNKPYVDNEGFYWIKATDGHYFKVQFSKINQIGVNLLPFEINGNEVRPSGFFGWKAKEFSADYLHPMSTVLFLGKSVMCPNNVREFLDFKNV
ncbi:ribitol 5-phosphate transferase FKRP [Bactrocera dorsalis]|uniref:Ribitol 5-phosphate transferase FKRP n=1 Tax=Bactrocera dorsalis TaxID=27457 RepID=A0A6I9V2T4_BACDO|nr:ribitol 5-phosphate transferase FKRP [Bactrocera dorsalis]